MSLILKGIDLPKGDTAEVIIRIQPNGEVRDIHGILLDAKAIQIPKGHGDIKDIDQITKLLPKVYLGGISHMVINDAPTILEAEE